MKPIHNLLRQRLQQAQKPLIEHPPIDLLSAFAERALSGFEHAPVFEHLAECPDCRNLAFLAAPEIDANSAVAPVPGRSDPRASWISWPALRWASAAACAVIVVAAVGLRPRHQARQGIASSVSRPSTTVQANGQIASSQDGDQASTLIASSAQPSPADVPAKAKESEARSLDITGEPGIPGVAHSREVSFTQSNRPAPRWTLSADGTLHRSLDNGITWQTVPTPRGRRFRAVAADGLHIWLGGARGVLLHSADAGQHWNRMRPAIGNDGLIADIIAIEFDDVRHGMLTTFGDGTWTTSDGGRSWIRE